MKKVVLLGSTGSIGVSAIKVAEDLPDQIRLVGLAAGGNLELLLEQTRKHRPEAVSINDPGKARAAKEAVGASAEVHCGAEGLVRLATLPAADIVLIAIVGTAGLQPALAAIRAGKDIAVASKEILVMAGEIVMSEARQHGVRVLAVDSEHSAIFQCLDNKPGSSVRNLWLTASGGPFRTTPKSEFSGITVARALKHPSWVMGRKITIDSATLFNKGLEMIEARWLFDIEMGRVQVVVHPQSVVHSMVEFVDGSIIAQLSTPDMCLPIQYALTYPHRARSERVQTNLAKLGSLTFEEPDLERFPSLTLARRAGETGGTLPAVLNAANEIAVEAYVNGRITFTQITEIVQRTMDRHQPASHPTLEQILEADAWARKESTSAANPFPSPLGRGRSFLPTELFRLRARFDANLGRAYARKMASKNFREVAVLLHDTDHVAVLKMPVRTGDELVHDSTRLRVLENIGPGHKIALAEIADGAAVRKYGQIIGFANGPIAAGRQVHTHNLAWKDFGRDYQFCVEAGPVNYHPPERMRYFPGYARPGGRVGTRNYLAVISSVNCSASVSHFVRDHFRTGDFKRDFPNVDGVIAFTHKGGCAMDAGEPRVVLQRVLAGIARHPNISGYVMIGLGCEVNQIEAIRRTHRLDESRPGETVPTFLNIQATGGARKTVEAGVAAVTRLLPVANELRRSSQPISKLVLAENCGGSDGNSGITANPALGCASDELVRYGGTSVLAETPEIYGAEHLLARRAVSREVGEQLIRLIRWWENHARRHDCTIDNNPSHGNKEGGLTTIYEKSLGAVAKGGQSPLAAVYQYAEPILASGFCFMDTPGYDPVSMTGLVAGGCNVGVFTTGRGSVYGCKPAPCIKVATNTPLYRRMEEDMDLNAGTILDGAETIEQVGARILEKIIAVAGGEKTKSELAGIGDEEFAPWQLGPTF